VESPHELGDELGCHQPLFERIENQIVQHLPPDPLPVRADAMPACTAAGEIVADIEIAGGLAAESASPEVLDPTVMTAIRIASPKSAVLSMRTHSRSAKDYR
jgi:hypothetical protein